MSRHKIIQIINRLLLAAGVKTQTQLAELLGVSQPAIAQSLKKESVPDEWLYKIAYRTGRRFEWLKTGEGPEFVSDAVAQAEEKYGLTRSPSLKGLLEQRADLTAQQQQIVDRAVEMLLDADPDNRTLMLQVLERVYEHYKFTRQQRDSHHQAKNIKPA